VPLDRRCRSLETALAEIDAGTLPHGARIVVSLAWWAASVRVRAPDRAAL